MNVVYKFLAFRVASKSVTPFVRILLFCFVGFYAFGVYENYYSSNAVTLQHVDSEAGIICSIFLDGDGGGKIQCTKEELIGVDLLELDLSVKYWDYKLGDRGVLEVSRVGVSDGIKINVKHSTLQDSISYVLKF